MQLHPSFLSIYIDNKEEDKQNKGCFVFQIKVQQGLYTKEKIKSKTSKDNLLLLLLLQYYYYYYYYYYFYHIFSNVLCWSLLEDTIINTYD